MLAKRINLNILYNDNLLVILVKQGSAQNLLRVEAVAMGEVLHGLGCTQWGFNQPLTGRVFLNDSEYVMIAFG